MHDDDNIDRCPSCGADHGDDTPPIFGAVGELVLSPILLSGLSDGSISRERPMSMIRRFCLGDWGDTGQCGQRLNNQAVFDATSIMARYVFDQDQYVAQVDAARQVLSLGTLDEALAVAAAATELFQQLGMTVRETPNEIMRKRL